MSEPDTFIAVLADLARREPGRLLLRQLRFDDASPDATLDALALESRARLLAGAIEAHAETGDRVVLALSPGVDYVVALYACFLARVAAVTSKPPTGRRGTSRFDAIVSDARASLVIVDPESRERVAASTSVAVLDARSEAPFLDRGANEPADIAVIQYTSGSTSTPRGVVLEHGALFEHASALVRVSRLESHQRVVTWLPPYHDMGLVATLLAPLSIGAEVVLFSPAEFAARPERWIEAIATHRAFLSGAPDFAYARVAARMRTQRAAELDLSSWKVAFNGAERVRPATIDAFTWAFAPSHFDRRAFFPAYGMAEATLAISIHRGTEAPPIVVRVDESAIARGEVVRVEKDGLALVGCGVPLEGVEVAIVDPLTRCALPADRVGEIWVRSRSAARAYFGREPESEATFEARRADGGESRSLRTGDLGFILDGELFVTGRLKDLIIVEGRNLYPDDLEETAETAHPDVVPHGVCAVALLDDGVERVVVVVEHTARRDSEVGAIRTAIRTALAVDHELSSVEVVLVGHAAIPRTSSGKPRRAETRRMLISGELAGLGEHRRSIDGDPPVDESLVDEIRRVVARLIGVESVGAEERFLDLGAQSTVLVSLAAALSDALATSVPISAVFDAATPRELALALGRLPRRPLLRPERAHDDSAPAPLGLSQERMWFLHAIDPSSSAYNVAFTVDLDGPIDESALASAVDLVVSRHDPLRTRFVRESDSVATVVDPDGPALGFVDCDESELEAELERFANTSFDLERAIPTRVRLFRIGPERASLAFSIHHVAIDGAAIDVVVDELVAAYTALVERIVPELPATPVTFADYARWQRARIRDGSLEEGRAYFESRLADAPQVVALPTDRPRGAGASTAGSIHRFPIPRALLERLAALAATRGATAYMALHAAFAVFLGRHTGSNDLAIATPIANRLEPGTERIVGSLVNTVVIRSRLGETTTFVELLDRVRVECVGAYAHQDYPFERLVESLARGRDASHAPITQVMFDYQLHRDATRHRAGVTFRGRGISRNAEQFDLTLAIVDLGERIEAAFGYRTSLFDASTIERLSSRWLTLLESLVGDPFVPVAEASLLPAEERAFLETTLHGPRVDAPVVSVVESFERARRSDPDAVAIVFGDRSVTYAELDARSASLAAALLDAGVVRGDLVALALARTPDLVASMLAVLRIGGAYVPLDPTYPRARIAAVLEDAAPRVILTDTASESVLPDAGTGGVGGILRADAIDAPARVALPTVVAPTDLAYVIFTSGSTGRPKGVRVSHGALSNFLRSMQRALDVRSDDRLLAITTVAFDIAGLEIFLPLVAGASVALTERDEAIDARRLAARLDRGDCTIFQATPSTYRGLVEVGAVFDPSMRFLVGGEALTETLADAITDRGATLFNVYGPTETTIWSTMGRVLPGVPVSLGRPIDNTSLRVVDANLDPVPVGVEGELLIGGAGVADGYLGRADLDAERFVVGVDRLEPNARFYRTGDRVRVRPDGSLSFHGRTDFQVKLRGHRIELGEIERAVATHPSVFACVVRLVRFGEGDDRLVAHCVGSIPIDTNAIREHASTLLPAYMVPAHIVGIPSLPMTPNGKIDRDALVFEPSVADVRATVAPRTETERVVAGIYASVLGVENVDAHTSFFDVGGHSFLAVRVFASIERELAVTLPLRTLFEQPTVAELARAVDEARVVDRGIVRRFGTGRRDPIVIVHASADDESLDVARCVSELAPDRTVVALHAPERPFLVLDALAAFYVQAMVHAELTEPATLVGFGLGGNIAHAMAAELAARGAAVADLLVVESLPPPDRRVVQITTAMRRIAAPIADRLARVVATARATGLGERYRELVPPYDDAYLDHRATRIDRAMRVFGAKGDARRWREFCAFAEDRPIVRGASAREIAASLIA